MATMENDILFNIKIDDDKAVQALIKLRNEQERLKKSIKNTEEAQKAGRDLRYGEIKALEVNKAKLKDVNDQIRTSERVLKANVAQQTKNAESINDLGRNLNLLKNRYNDMSDAQRASTGGVALLKQIDATREKFEKLKSSIGENQFAVGRYAEEGKKVFAEFGGTLGSAFSAGITGIQSMGTALKANPMILIITALLGAFSGLKNMFMSFEPFADWFTQKMAYLSGLFDGFKQIFYSLFSNETAKPMGEIAKAYENLEKRSKALRNSQIELTVTHANERLEFEKLRLTAKDRTKTDQERLTALTKAIAIEKSILEDRKKIAYEEWQIIKEKNAQAHSNEAARKAEAEAQAKYYEVESSTLSGMRRLQSEYTGFIKEESDKRLANLNKYNELRISNMQDGLDKEIATEKLRYKNARKEAIETGVRYDYLLQQLRIEHNNKIRKIKADAAQKQLSDSLKDAKTLNDLELLQGEQTELSLIEKKKQGLTRIFDLEITNKQLSINERKLLEANYIKDIKALTEQSEKTQLKIALDANKEVNDKLELELKNSYTTEENYQKALTALKQSKLETDLQILRAYYGTEAEIQAKQNELNNFYADQKIAKQKQVTAEIQAENQKRIESEQKYQAVLADGINNTAAIFGEMLINMEQSNEQFQKALVLSILDTLEKIIQLAIVEIVAREIGTKSFAGIATGAALAGIVKGLFAGVKSKVSASYYNGGYTGDGDTTAKAGQVEYGEYVINNRDLRSIGGVAAVESILPSRKFTSALPITNNLSGAINNNNQFAEALKNLKVITTIEAIDKVASQEAARINYSKF